MRIETLPMDDGRVVAYLADLPSGQPEMVGAETSFASLERGENQRQAAVTALRRLYPDLQRDLEVVHREV